jgi:hypothetical protein
MTFPLICIAIAVALIAIGTRRLAVTMKRKEPDEHETAFDNTLPDSYVPFWDRLGE